MNNCFEKIYNKISKDIKLAQYGPGYATPWSDVRPEISSKGPIRSQDADNPAAESRSWPYAAVENEMVQEWGEDRGMKPDGTFDEIEKRTCNRCYGKGCVKCKNKGYIRKKIKQNNTSPKIDGRMLEQLRYQKKPAWPHNRDYNNIREEPQTWEQMMSEKNFLGKPSLF